jgi:hypothetical protein
MNSSYLKKKIVPRFSKIVGRGLSLPTQEEKYREFGKYVISMPHLNQSVLKMKYKKSLTEIPSYRQIKISEDFVDFIENLLDTQKVNEKMLNKLPSEEKRLFAKLINQSGLFGKYKVRIQKSDQEKAEEDRFNLVKGIFVAGNDNPKVKEELRRFIVKFVMEGRIPKAEGNDLLFQLSI